MLFGQIETDSGSGKQVGPKGRRNRGIRRNHGKIEFSIQNFLVVHDASAFHDVDLDLRILPVQLMGGDMLTSIVDARQVSVLRNAGGSPKWTT